MYTSCHSKKGIPEIQCHFRYVYIGFVLGIITTQTACWLYFFVLSQSAAFIKKIFKRRKIIQGLSSPLFTSLLTISVLRGMILLICTHLNIHRQCEKRPLLSRYIFSAAHLKVVAMHSIS